MSARSQLDSESDFPESDVDDALLGRGKRQ